MGTDKRARQKANRQAKREQLQAEAKAESREVSTRRFVVVGAVVAAIVALIVLLNVLGGGSDDDGADTITFTPTPAPQDDSGPAAVELADAVPADFEPFAGTGALAGVEPGARNGAYDAPPAMSIDTDKTYLAVINTDAGPIRLRLFDDEAPVTVNNFVNLARDGFYDGTIFHRVLEGFMAQAGDPTGTGTGGPGYQFEDEFVDTLRFDRAGLLAMANAGAGTNGSQFFLTFGPTTHLNDAHTIFGELETDEDPILSSIKLRDPSDVSAEATIIESVTIVEI